MAHTEASLSKLNKDNLVRLTLGFQHKHYNLLGKLMEDFANLKANYLKLEADLFITRTVSDTFKNRKINFERKCLRNEQCSRHEYLEIPGSSNGTPNSQLEDKVIDVFEKIDFAVKSKNIEACHWIKTQHDGRRVIVKLSKCQDADRIRKVKIYRSFIIGCTRFSVYQRYFM